jgi:hypothetical protein
VLVAVRNDEAEHRDVNHRFATDLARKRLQLKKERQEKRQELWSKVTRRKSAPAAG